LPRTEITADEIKRAFHLPPATELTYQLPVPPSDVWVPEVWPIETIAVGVGAPRLTTVESDPTFICG
jgi:hypothetical protein